MPDPNRSPPEASKRRSRAGRRVGAYPARSRSSTKPILSGGPHGGDDSRSVGGAGSAACRERAGRPCPGLGAATDAAGAGGGLGGPGALAAGGELPSLWRGGEPPRRPQSPPGRNRLRSGGVVPPAATLCRVWAPLPAGRCDARARAWRRSTLAAPSGTDGAVRSELALSASGGAAGAAAGETAVSRDSARGGGDDRERGGGPAVDGTRAGTSRPRADRGRTGRGVGA